jgi:hypothetical protein
MWAVFGFLLATAIGVPAVLWMTRHGSPRVEGHPWLVSDTVMMHVTILGGLAGFAITGVVLLVSLARDQPGTATSAFNTVLVMFLVAYFYYVGSAFLVSYLPNRDASGVSVPRVHFSLASTLEYRTLFISWFALRPLLDTYHLEQPAHVLTVLLPLSLLLGSVIIAVIADGHQLMRIREVYIAAALGTGLALSYAAAIAIVGSHAKSSDSALHLTIALFCVNGLGFATAALTPLATRYPAVATFYERHGRRIVLVDMQLTMTSLAFLWLAVVGAF